MGLNWLFTLAAAAAGSIAAKKVKLPVPYMVGAMIGTAVYNVITGEAQIVWNARFFTQALSGIFVGLSISRDDLKNISLLIKPALIMCVGFAFFTAGAGYLIHCLYSLDLATSFLVCVPGGMIDISLMAYDFNADPAMVSFIQTFRVFSVPLFFPPIISALSKHLKTSEQDAVKDIRETEEKSREEGVWNKRGINFFATTVIALGGGYLGLISGMPAGTMSFAMLAVAAFNLISGRAYFPDKYRKYVQLVAGTVIGVGITMETVVNLRYAILPMLTVILFYLVFDFLISIAMTKTGGVDYLSSLFAASPAGASDMALIASEIGGQSPKIALLHVCRLLAVYMLFPTWVKFLISGLS